MTDQPTGRDLDRAVAEAMGWKKIEDPLLWMTPDGSTTIGYREYSTYAGCLPEMLAWLHKHADGIRFELCRPVIASGAGAMEWHAQCWERGRHNVTVGGKFEVNAYTLPEAVARLVVAVAKERK